VTNALNVTSAARLADSSDKGNICIAVSVAVKNIQVAYTPTVAVNADIGNGSTVTIAAGLESQRDTPCTNQAAVNTYGPDGHRTTDAVTIYVVFE
jgi:hypothetical protein